MRRNPLHDYADPAFERMRISVTTPPEIELPWEDRLLAGCAEVDITPTPGMPKAGHSKNAHDGTGFRTRLRARVLHLRAGHSSLVLIACDLLSGSAIVHRLLADQIADDTDVRPSGLFLGATHTHAGPGQFSGSEFYNRWSSNRPGFDPAYTGFLVDQLAGAVQSAVAQRRPARLAFGSTEVWGYTRNRSLPAHVRNANEPDKRTDPQRKYAAINPWLHLLRVDEDAPEDDSRPMAAFAWFSIHGTGISHHDRSYNADVWAYLTGELAQRVQERTGTRPVVGAVEGTHGDMTPAVRTGMLVFPEAERVGRGIGAAAAELYDQLTDRLHSTTDLAAGLREVDMDAHPEVAGVTLPEPRIGVAKLAGAQENTTPVLDLIPPFRPGFPRRRPRGPQAEKRVVAGESVHRVVNPTASFPRYMPVQLLRIDDATIVGLPFEVTVEAGNRIAEAVGDATPGTATVVVSSLANDHCDYLTTAEEYGAQYYEGASTLYGPRQQQFVAGCAATLAAELTGKPTVADLPDHRVFDFTIRHYYAQPDGRTGSRTTDPARFVEATAVEDAHWRMDWSDVGPGDLHWHEPLVRVQAEQPDGSWAAAHQDGRPADDQGWRVGVEYLGHDDGRHRYVARWFAPPLGRPGRHRFVLCANAGRPEVAGQPFD